MAAQTAYAAACAVAAQSPDLHIEKTALASEPLLPVGTRLGEESRYVIEEIVAVGGMATVYKASDIRLNATPCAIKAMFRPERLGTPADAASDEDAAAFREEARLLAALRHPGIVSVRDYFEQTTTTGRFAFIVQEFVDGQNLYDRHRRMPRFGEDPENLPIAPVPEDQIALYGIALSRALEYLHTREPGILYRDLKPHNIVRRASDGQLVLLDFGISRRVSARLKRCYSDDLGTPGYAAPEQYERFGVLDARTDLYSLGVVLAELATGYNPRAANAPRVIPRLDTLSGRLSPTLRRILQKCVESHPAARYADARELADTLEAWRKIPRRLRSLREPSAAWQLCPEPSSSSTGRKPALPQLATIGDSGEAFALALPSGSLRLIDAASGETLVERAPAEPNASAYRYRLLPHARGRYLALISEPGAENGLGNCGARIDIFDQGLKPCWRLRIEHARLQAAWLTGAHTSITESDSEAEVSEIARLVVASRKNGNAPGGVIACAENNESPGEWGYAWRTGLPADPTVLSPSGDGGLLVLDASGALSQIDCQGIQNWQVQIAFLRNASGPVHLTVSEQLPGIALLCCGTTVEAVRLDSGVAAWRAAWIGFVPSAPQATLDGSRILLPTRECGLVDLDAATGRATPLTSDFPRAVAGLTRLLPESDIFAVAEAGTGARLALYDAERRKLLWHTDLPAHGASAAPCVSDEADIIAIRDFAGGITAWRWSSVL